MTRRRSTLWAWGSLGLLTVAELVSLYEAAFSLWMTAYPFADIRFWRVHLYFRLVQAALCSVLWIAVAAWLFRRRAAARIRD